MSVRLYLFPSVLRSFFPRERYLRALLASRASPKATPLFLFKNLLLDRSRYDILALLALRMLPIITTVYGMVSMTRHIKYLV